MIILNLFLFLIFLILLIKCAGYAIKYSLKLATVLHFPEFIVSFFIIALISILPEATIAIISAFKGEPELGLGTLLGSNIIDLTLVFGIVALFSSKGIKVKSKILNNNLYYLILLLFPLIFGFDGKFLRIEGLILVLSGLLFFVKTYLDSYQFHKKVKNTKKEPFFKNLLLLILSLIVLLLSAFLTVNFVTNFAFDAKLPAILVGITIIALGTCLPELIFSIRAVKKNHDGLALGDLLGTVIADSTIILGLVALISPFSYNPFNMYIIGTALFLAGIFVTSFMKSDKLINKTEGIILIFFYIFFVFAELFINHLYGIV